MVVRSDLSYEQILVQSGHALLEMSREIKSDFIHPHFVMCSVANEAKLYRAMDRLEKRGVKCIPFREPDRGNELTAFATTPSCDRKPMRFLKLFKMEKKNMEIQASQNEAQVKNQNQQAVEATMENPVQEVITREDGSQVYKGSRGRFHSLSYEDYRKLKYVHSYLHGAWAKFVRLLNFAESSFSEWEWGNYESMVKVKKEKIAYIKANMDPVFNAVVDSIEGNEVRMVQFYTGTEPCKKHGVVCGTSSTGDTFFSMLKYSSFYDSEEEKRKYITMVPGVGEIVFAFRAAKKTYSSPEDVVVYPYNKERVNSLYEKLKQQEQ